MDALPRISVVTPSFNQGKFIGETIESVLAQEYPNLEHIIVDGGSTDCTHDVLSRYPHLIVISEPDNGQAEAINKGFRIATGNIFCFLNSDDTLLLGALHRVAREIDPSRGRHIVMGRCRFVDEKGVFIGIEHPSYFEGHRRVLEIWKGHFIPQPSVFWSREVWEKCGPMNEAEHFCLDYDLFCRFSKHYRFHRIDQVFSTYRLHADSKTSSITDPVVIKARLEDSIRISKRYWGSPLSLQYWRLVWSLALFRLNRRGRARILLGRAQGAWIRRAYVEVLKYLLVSAVVGPDVILNVVILPQLKFRLYNLLSPWLKSFLSRHAPLPQTEAYRDFTDIYNDGWVGPRLSVERELAPGDTHLTIHADAIAWNVAQPFELLVYVDGEFVGQRKVKGHEGFIFHFPLRGEVQPGSHTVEVHANASAVPHETLQNGDFRPLSYHLVDLRFENEDEAVD